MIENNAIIDFGKFNIKILELDIRFLSPYENISDIPDNSDLAKILSYLKDYKSYVTDEVMCIFYKIIKTRVPLGTLVLIPRIPSGSWGFNNIMEKKILWNQMISVTNPKIKTILEAHNGRSFIELLGFEIDTNIGKMKLQRYDIEFFNIIKRLLKENYDCK